MTTTSELDSFGPWIDQVTSAEDVPALFRAAVPRPDVADLVLKVPRDIPRRDVTAGMDLYDHLLVLAGRRLRVLSRCAGPDGTTVAPGFTMQEIPVDRIAAVHDTVNLLAGELTVTARDGSSLTLPYNGSGRDQLQRLIDALLAGVTGAGPSRAGAALIRAGRFLAQGPAAIAIGRDDQGLLGDLRDLARHRPLLRPWVGHGRRRVRAGLSPTTLQAAVLAEDGDVLEVLGRHQWLLIGRQPVHSSGRLMVPFEAIDAVTVHRHDRWAGVWVGRLRTGQAVVDIPVPEGSAAHGVFDAAARETAHSPYLG